MSIMIKALIICLSINLSLTLFGFSVAGADAFSIFYNRNGDTLTPTSQFSLTNENTSLPLNLNGGSTGGAAVGTGVTSTTGNLAYNFIDPLKMSFSGLILIITSIFFPVMWGFILNLPGWLTLLLGLETILGIAGAVFLIRGVQS